MKIEQIEEHLVLCEATLAALMQRMMAMMPPYMQQATKELYREWGERADAIERKYAAHHQEKQQKGEGS